MKSFPWLACIVDGILCAGTFLESCHVKRAVKPAWGNWRASNLHMAPLLHLPANLTSYAGCFIVRWRKTYLLNENGLFNKDFKSYAIFWKWNQYENESGCNFGSSGVVDFPVKVDAIIPGFSKNLPLLKCIWPLYWPNTRGNLNRSVLQKVPFRHKRARVAEGMNARWSVDLISAYLMAGFAPCKGIRILECGRLLLVESIWYPFNLWKSWILDFEMWNTAHGTQNPLSNCAIWVVPHKNLTSVLSFVPDLHVHWGSPCWKLAYSAYLCAKDQCWLKFTSLLLSFLHVQEFGNKRSE